MAEMVPKRFPWPALFVGGLAVLAALPFFPAQSPAYSLDATSGRVLYGVTLVGLVIAYIVAQWMENVARVSEQEKQDTLRRSEQADRDALSESRHIAELAAVANLSSDMKASFQHQFATWAWATQERDSLRAKGVTPDNPKYMELADTVRVSAATMGNIITASVSESVSAADSVTASVSSSNTPPRQS